MGPGFRGLGRTGPRHVEKERELYFGAVDAELDWRFDARTGAADFTFLGFDEGDEISGRGWAKIEAGQLILNPADKWPQKNAKRGGKRFYHEIWNSPVG